MRETFQHCQATNITAVSRYKSSDFAKQQEEIRSLKVNNNTDNSQKENFQLHNTIPGHLIHKYQNALKNGK